MAVALLNKERRMQVFNLPHEIYCQAVGQCGCAEQMVTTVAENPMTGERMPKSLKRKLPASLTLLALEKRDGVPDAALDIPEIKRAVARGRIRVLSMQPENSAQPTSFAAPTDSKPRKEKDKK